MWQTLTILAMLGLGFAAFLESENKKGLEEILKDRRKVQTRVEALNSTIDRTKEAFIEAQEAKEEALAENAEKLQEKEDLVARLEDITQQIEKARRQKLRREKDFAALEKMEEFKDEMGGVFALDELKLKLGKINSEIADINSELASKQAMLATFKDERERLMKGVQRYRNLEDDQRNRVSSADLNARISSAYQDYGFVIVGAGYNQGVVTGSKLEVLRDGRQIATLRVTTVEPSKSAADIDSDSLAASVRLRSGDEVRAVRPVVEQAAPQSPSIDEPTGDEDSSQDPLEGSDDFLEFEF